MNKFKSKRQRETYFGTHGKNTPIQKESLKTEPIEDDASDKKTKTELLEMQKKLKVEIEQKKNDRKRELNELKKRIALKLIMQDMRRTQTILGTYLDNRVSPENVIMYYGSKRQ